MTPAGLTEREEQLRDALVSQAIETAVRAGSKPYIAANSWYAYLTPEARAAYDRVVGTLGQKGELEEQAGRCDG